MVPALKLTSASNQQGHQDKQRTWKWEVMGKEEVMSSAVTADPVEKHVGKESGLLGRRAV